MIRNALDTAADDRPALLIAADRSDDPRTRRFSVAGEMDTRGATFLLTVVIEALRQHPPAYLEINLRCLIRIDSVGIVALRMCHTAALRVNCRLMLTDPHPLVYSLILRAGLPFRFGSIS